MRRSYGHRRSTQRPGWAANISKTKICVRSSNKLVIRSGVHGDAPTGTLDRLSLYPSTGLVLQSCFTSRAANICKTPSTTRLLHQLCQGQRTIFQGQAQRTHGHWRSIQLLSLAANISKTPSTDRLLHHSCIYVFRPSTELVIRSGMSGRAANISKTLSTNRLPHKLCQGQRTKFQGHARRSQGHRRSIQRPSTHCFSYPVQRAQLRG